MSEQKEPHEKSVGNSEIKIVSDPPLEEWYPVYRSVFPDDSDDYDMGYLRKEFGYTGPLRSHFLLLEDSGHTVGAVWYVEDEENRYVYIPYAGVTPEERNKGTYTKIYQKLREGFRDQGIKAIVGEKEDPEKIEDPEKKSIAERRIGYFTGKIGRYIVDPHEMPYLRGGWTKTLTDKEIVNNDYMLDFEPLADPAEYVKEEGGQKVVPKEKLREMYMSIMRMDMRSTSPEDLRNVKAVKQYNQNLDNYPKPSVPLMRIPTKP